MDLGIKGKNAIVCAASKGLGKGCAMSLAREGVNITMNARTKDVLEAAAKEIRDATGVRVTTVAGDITTDAVRAALLQACPNPDILVNNAGGPPPAASAPRPNSARCARSSAAPRPATSPGRTSSSTAAPTPAPFSRRPLKVNPCAAQGVSVSRVNSQTGYSGARVTGTRVWRAPQGGTSDG